MTETAMISEIKRGYLTSLAKDGKRLDGRTPEEYREVSVMPGIIGSAEGSARVRIGHTEILGGVKIAVGTPFADRPGAGVLITNAEFIPLASPTFESGPPREDAVELARVVDRGIRESGTLDLSKMCIKEGEKVWMVFIDLHVLDHDGNLFDTGGLAALSALMCASIPSELDDSLEDPMPLSVEHYPIPCTAAKIEDTILIDPMWDEEQIADARLTVTTDENGDIRAMQKGLSGSFTFDEVKSVVSRAVEMGKIHRKIVQKAS